MLDQPQDVIIQPDVSQEVVIQEVTLNTDGESVTTVYSGVDGGIYSCQIPSDLIPVDNPTSQEAVTFLSTYVVER